MNDTVPIVYRVPSNRELRRVRRAGRRFDRRVRRYLKRYVRTAEHVPESLERLLAEYEVKY
jgi:hypothetical protein